jgi:hypothetical protein
MYLADEAQAEWQFLQQLKTVADSADVVRDLLYVFLWNAWSNAVLVQKEVGQRRLRPLDLAREHGLLPNVAVEQLVGTGEQAPNAVEPPKSDPRVFKAVLHARVDQQRRFGRERPRYEGTVT